MKSFLTDVDNPGSLSNQLRRRRDVRLKALISEIHENRGRVNILDMGGTFSYWQRVGVDFLSSVNANVTVLNVEATRIDGENEFPELFSDQIGDACSMPNVKDGEFDLSHSNSVIEHVVTWPNMKAFSQETRRVADYYYVQTPYFWFPIDPHYYSFPMYHWFPRPVRARLVSRFPITHVGRIPDVDMAFHVVDSARLLDRRQFDFLFPDADIKFERFAGLAKSMIAVRGPQTSRVAPG